MVRYRFFPGADAAQDDIWRDTCGRWGEKQAEVYILGLHSFLARLADNRSLWRRLTYLGELQAELGQTLYFGRYQQHLVFFRELSDGSLGIISILHQRMDMPSRLAEELSRPDSLDG